MNKRNRITLAEIYRKPTSASLNWVDIERLFLALDGEVIERSGSRIAIVVNGQIAHFHRPHPGKEAKRYQIEAARDFLIRLGVRP